MNENIYMRENGFDSWNISQIDCTPGATNYFEWSNTQKI